MAFYLLALVPLALACGPGTGSSTATPTLKFTYSPPLAWTTNPAGKPVAGGQSLSLEMAQTRINTDIEFAVIKAVESYGYSTAGVVVKNAIAPDEVVIDVTKMPPDCTDTEYIAESGVVTKLCNATGTIAAAVPFMHVNKTITVTSPVALAQSNWDNIATKVWAALTNNAGVKFYGLIEVEN